MSNSGTDEVKAIEEMESTNESNQTNTEQSTEEVKDKSEELAKVQRAAQKAFDDKVQEAEDAFMEASLHVKDLQEQLKAAKKEQKESLDHVWDLKSKGPTIPTQLPEDEQQQFEFAGSSSAVENDTTWREVPIEEVIDGIEGFGNKKREAILESFANLGELEDLRAKASMQHKPFKDLLPDGFGEGVAQKLEDRIMEVISKHAINLAKRTASSEPVGFTASFDDVIEDQDTEEESDVLDESTDEEVTYADVDDSPAVENFETDDDLVEML